VTDSSEHLVRQVGPTAWAILEVLRRRAAADHDAVAPGSIRSLAAELGLAKNTVQRALRRLAAADLIEAHQARTCAGAFSLGHYVLNTHDTDPTRSAKGPAAVDDHARVPTAPSTPMTESTGQLTFGI
jgi:DNA-binding transcriptional MocR family regulator